MSPFLRGSYQRHENQAASFRDRDARASRAVHHRDRRAPYRRYAISYLGNRRCRAAEPALVKIVEDPHEEAFFRADALEAITRMNPQRGRRLAATYALDDQSISLDRSYWQALRGAHE